MGVTPRPARLFATPADEPRARRATDVILLVLSAVGLLAVSASAVPEPGFALAVGRLLASLPDVLDAIWQTVVDVLVVFAVTLVVASIVRRRASVTRDLVIALTLATVGWLILARWVEGSWPAWWEALGSADPPPWYPSPRVALPAAVVIAASPHLTRPVRRWGQWLVGLTALALIALGATTVLGALAGLLVAAASAGAVHLVFGSAGGRPGLDQVIEALDELGVPTTSIGAADRQPAGQFLVHATDDRGEPLVVKVYGRDAHDAALVSTLWRTVWYREAGSPLRVGRLQQVEHEAFLTLLAAQAGVRTDVVVTAGATADDDALLVLRRTGRRLADRPGTDAAWEIAPEVAAEVWDVVGRLRVAGIAHGQIDDRHLAVHDDELGLIDFRGATIAPSETQRRTDEIQALVTTSCLVGPEAAVSAALDALGPAGLADALPYLQYPALTGRQRRQLREKGTDLDALRATAASAAGAELPALERLRRITLGSVVRVVLPAIAVLALISAFAGLDVSELVDQLLAASWWLVVLGLLMTQVPRLTQSLSTLGAAPVPLPLGPVYALQLAVSYVNLAIPTAAARIAVNIRFFQRHGVPPGSAIAAGALDGFGGFVVQAMLLVSLLLLSPASLDLQFDGSTGTAARLLGLVVLIAVASVAVVLVVPRLRRFVVGWVRRLAAEAIGPLARPALPAPPRAAARRQPCHRGALRRLARHLHPGLRLPHRARRAPADQHQRRPPGRPAADPGRCRCERRGADLRAGAGRHARGDRFRRGAHVPPVVVLPPTDLGVLRAPLAGARGPPLDVDGLGPGPNPPRRCRPRAGHRRRSRRQPRRQHRRRPVLPCRRPLHDPPTGRARRRVARRRAPPDHVGECDTVDMPSSCAGGASPGLRRAVVLRVSERDCETWAGGGVESIPFAPMFPAPRTERVRPGHLVAIATPASGPEVVVWRWYDAVVLGTETSGRSVCGSRRTAR